MGLAKGVIAVQKGAQLTSHILVTISLSLACCAATSYAEKLKGWILIGSAHYDISGTLTAKIEDEFTLSFNVFDGTSILRSLSVNFGSGSTTITDGEVTYPADSSQSERWKKQILNCLWDWSRTNKFTVVSVSDTAVTVESDDTLMLTDFLEVQVRIEYEVIQALEKVAQNYVVTEYGYLRLESLSLISLDEWVNGYEQNVSCYIQFLQP